jgi:hypothetical protein
MNFEFRRNQAEARLDSPILKENRASDFETIHESVRSPQNSNQRIVIHQSHSQIEERSQQPIAKRSQ